MSPEAIHLAFPASRYVQVFGAFALNCSVAYFSRFRRNVRSSSVGRQPSWASASGSMTTTAGRVPIAPANAEIHPSYLSLSEPPLDSPEQSRPGMSYATRTGSLTAASAAPTYFETAVPMSPLQSPNQPAVGLSAIADLIWAARASPGLSRTHLAGLESGST